MKIFGRGKNEDTEIEELETGAEDAGFEDGDGGLSAKGRFGMSGGASGGKRVILLVLLVLLLIGGYVSMTMMGAEETPPVMVTAAQPAPDMGAAQIDPVTGLPLAPQPPVMADAGAMPPMPEVPDAPAAMDPAMPMPDAMGGMMPDTVAGVMPDTSAGVMPDPMAAGAMPPDAMSPDAMTGQLPVDPAGAMPPDAMAGMPAPDAGAGVIDPAAAAAAIAAAEAGAAGVSAGVPVDAANVAANMPPEELDPIDADDAVNGLPSADNALQLPEGAPMPDMAAPVTDANAAAPPVMPSDMAAVPAPVDPAGVPDVPASVAQPMADPAQAAAVAVQPDPALDAALPVDGAAVDPALAAAGAVDPASPANPADPASVAAAAPAAPAAPTAEEIAMLLAALPPEPAMVRPMPKEYLIVKKESAADTIDSRLASARRALNEGRPQAALQFFNELQNDFPNDSRVMMGRAVTMQRLGQNVEALRAYEQVLVNNPQNLDALTNMLGLLKSQNPGMAIEKLQALRDAYPYNADITTQLAIAYGESGNLQESLRYITLAEALKPDSSYVKYNKAVLYDRLGRRTEAGDLYRQLLRLAADGKLDRNISVETIRNRLAVMR